MSRFTERNLCGKQTRHGEHAALNDSGFAPCVLPAGHRDACDSGPAPKRVA